LKSPLLGSKTFQIPLNPFTWGDPLALASPFGRRPQWLPLKKQGCFIPFQTGFVKMVSKKIVSKGDDEMNI
jgi:hypothetical protein